jgi:hypothetical protein
MKAQFGLTCEQQEGWLGGGRRTPHNCSKTAVGPSGDSCRKKPTEPTIAGYRLSEEAVAGICRRKALELVIPFSVFGGLASRPDGWGIPSICLV